MPSTVISAICDTGKKKKGENKIEISQIQNLICIKFYELRNFLFQG